MRECKLAKNNLHVWNLVSSDFIMLHITRECNKSHVSWKSLAILGWRNRWFHWDSAHPTTQRTPPRKMHTLTQKSNDSPRRLPSTLYFDSRMPDFCSLLIPSKKPWKARNPYHATFSEHNENHLPIKYPLSIGGIRRGAEGGTWTRTVSLPTDFESVTSAIPSLRPKQSNYTIVSLLFQEWIRGISYFR